MSQPRSRQNQAIAAPPAKATQCNSDLDLSPLCMAAMEKGFEKERIKPDSDNRAHQRNQNYPLHRAEANAYKSPVGKLFGKHTNTAGTPPSMIMAPKPKVRAKGAIRMWSGFSRTVNSVPKLQMANNATTGQMPTNVAKILKV